MTQVAQLELMDALSELAREAYKHCAKIVLRMAASDFIASDGLEFAPIHTNLLSRNVRKFQRAAQSSFGQEIEMELLRVTGLVGPHYHRQCSCVIIRCDTEPDVGVEGHFSYHFGRDDWLPIEAGQLIKIPAGMVHGMRTRTAAHFISVNSPSFDPGDTLTSDVSASDLRVEPSAKP